MKRKTARGQPKNFLRLLGPGLITGAADDDPSCIALPVLVVLMLLSSNRKVMGKFRISTSITVLGWLTTAVMALVALGLFVSFLT